MGYFINLLELSGLNMMLALSVYATLKVGQFSLAQVGFWAIGAYVTGILTAMYAVPLLPALLVSGAICAVVGLLLGYPCLRIRGIYLTLATVAFLELVRVFFRNFEFTRPNGPATTIGPAGAMGFRGIPLLTTWVEILIAVVLTAGLFAWIERSRLGLSVQAVREDETAAACTGIPVVALKVGMFALGAAIAGVGGGLYATYTTFVNSDNFGFHLGLMSIFFVTVGGTERFWGPLAGSLLLTFLPELLRPVGDFRMVVYGALVLVLMILLPRGVTEEIRARVVARRHAVPGPAASGADAPAAPVASVASKDSSEHAAAR
jgi:branched-chain amino acid transport system permease protein